MGLFDQFPYTNFHELNLMWILEALKEIKTTTEQFVAINSLKYANPIQWNITSQYEKNTIVIDPQTGTAYISVQPVPTGVALTNNDYWTVVFDLGSFVTRAAKNFTTRWEAETTNTATFPSAAGSWLVWGDTLYKALVNITAGDQYVVDSNIQHFTMEDVLGHLEDLDTTDKDNLVAAINEVLTTLNSTAGDLADLTTTDKDNLVAAINEVLTILNSTTGDLADLTTTDKDNLVAAINENAGKIANIIDHNTPVNILDCGITGDGSDEAAALQAVLNGDYGNYIVIPAGVSIHIHSGVTMNTAMILEGESNLTSKIIGHGAINILTIPQTGANGSVIKNIRFDYDGGWDAVTSGTQLACNGRDILIDNCAFYHYVVALSIDNALHVNVTNCYFTEGNSVGSGTYAKAIDIGATDWNSAIKIEGITILSDDTKQAYCGIRLQYVDGIYISNILINRCQYGMLVYPSTAYVHGAYFSSILFDQCQIIGVDIRPNTSGRVSNLKFINCWISTNDSVTATAVAIRGTTGTTTQFVSFIGCNIMSAATGLLVNGTNISQLTFTDNMFTQVKGNVVLINSGDSIILSNNQIKPDVEDNTDSYVNGFNIDGCDNLILHHNISKNATNSDCIVANVPNFRYWQNLFSTSNLFNNEQNSGSTADRPVVKYVGMPYYDTTLAKPIWWNGSDWIDAAGVVQN